MARPVNSSKSLLRCTKTQKQKRWKVKGSLTKLDSSFVVYPKARSSQGLAPGNAKTPPNLGVTARGSIWAGPFRNRSTTTATKTFTTATATVGGTPRSQRSNTARAICPPSATTTAPLPASVSDPTVLGSATTGRVATRSSNPPVPSSTLPPLTTMAAQGPIVDPTKPAKYPIILSDALLGKTSKETYTGIRYNHKPALSSDTAPASARLKRSAKDGVFNLGFDDHGDKYQYSGSRTSEDGKYVLIFDPARKAFILHRVDSLFHMNLTRTPTDGNVESLRKQFPHLEVKGDGASSSSTKQAKGKASATGKATTTAGKGKAAKGETAAAKAKADKNKVEKNKTMALTLPSASTSKPATPPPAPAAPPAAEKKSGRRARSPIDSEEDDDDDDGLIVEYPGMERSNQNFSPAFPTQQRRFSEFIRGQEDEEEGADSDIEFEDVEGANNEDNTPFKLSSPVIKTHQPITEPAMPVEVPDRFVFSLKADSDVEEDGDFDMADADGDGEVDADADVDDVDEEALLMEFQGEEGGNESDISEEE